MEELTVSMPTYNTPAHLLERAVDSVLSQTFRNLRLVVVNDGGGPIQLNTKDPRLTVFEMGGNKGRYFADAVVLSACRTPFITMHDSDDWSEPERYEEMLNLIKSSNADVVAGATRWHLLNGSTRVHIPSAGPSTGRLVQLWHTSALYRVDSLTGLIYPKHPVSADAFHSSIMSLVAKVALYKKPNYHWEEREGSLTTSADTGMRSRRRAVVQAEMSRLIREVRRKAYRAPDKRQVARALILDSVGQECREEVEDKARKLRPLLSDRPKTIVGNTDTVVTILTGGRPDLLRQTIKSTIESLPGFLENSHVIALINGNDEATQDVIGAFSQLIDEVRTTEEMLPTTKALDMLAEYALESSRNFWLHLEDDWEASPCNGWLVKAQDILNHNPRVGQVKLRQFNEVILATHVLTRRKLLWQYKDQDWRLCPDIHWTNNPSLMRVKDIPKMMGGDDEPNTARIWRGNGFKAGAQLIPGVWRHIGQFRSVTNKRW